MTITSQQVDAWDAAVDAAYKRGLHDGMKQERALWELSRLGQEIEAQPEQETATRQYQSRDGVWKDFISEKHYKDTLEDGSWPIRNLYASPPPQRT